MIELLHMLQGVVERGLIFSCMAASVYIAARLINFDNLAVEGAFGLGGAITAYLLLAGFNPWISFFGAIVAGVLSGIMTGLLYTKLHVNKLMSGIVVTTGLFSIALKIAGSNMTLGSRTTIFSSFQNIVDPYQSLIVLLILVLVLFGIIH